jgi:hypothetical protein
MEVMLLVVLALYFLPSLIAAVRSHHQQVAIVGLNLLLGWTLVGWVVALVWALTAIPRGAADPNELRPCPACAEPVRREARRCRYCQEPLTPLNPPPSLAYRLGRLAGGHDSRTLERRS